MMNRPTINDARWQEWTDKYLAAECVDPGREKTEMIMGFFLTRRSLDAHELSHLHEEFTTSHAYKVCEAHARRIGLKLDEEGMEFLTLISDNPGEVVMHVHGARRVQQKLGVEELTMKDLFLQAFQGGLRQDSSLHVLWLDQKLTTDERELLGGGMDNYIDHVVAA